MSYQLYPRHQHDSGKRYCNLATNMQHYHWVLTVHWRKLHFDCCLRSRHKKRGLICLSVGRCAVNTHRSGECDDGECDDGECDDGEC